MSFDELQDDMLLDPDSIEDQLIKSQRTLQRDIKDIETIYGIVIVADRSSGKNYIEENTENTHSQRLRESFDLINAIRLSKSLGNSLVFEERKSLGTHHMSGLLHSVQNSLKVKFDYHKFYDATDSKREVMPIALKETRNRWYLIAKDVDNIIKNFALDRIMSLLITEIKFKPIGYNVHQEFKYSFGIINGTDEKPINVTLSFTAREGRYIESLPLHRSQKLISKNDKEYQFTYFVGPTYDFQMELLSYGNQVKVLEPETLRASIKRKLKEAIDLY
jgi:predicted DNA-binding transcriptional regulator YafY